MTKRKVFVFVLIHGNQSEFGTIRVRIAIYNNSEWVICAWLKVKRKLFMMKLNVSLRANEILLIKLTFAQMKWKLERNGN